MGKNRLFWSIIIAIILLATSMAAIIITNVQGKEKLEATMHKVLGDVIITKIEQVNSIPLWNPETDRVVKGAQKDLLIPNGTIRRITFESKGQQKEVYVIGNG